MSTNNHEDIHWALHVDNWGKITCEIKYEDQIIFLPIELVQDFSEKLTTWAKNVIIACDDENRTETD